MFNSDLAAAVTTALGVSGDTLAAGNLDAVAELLNEAVAHFGLGVTTSSLGVGVATYTDLGAVSLIATYANTFTVNGLNGTIDYAASDVVFPASAVVNEGDDVDAVPSAQKLWTVTVKLDGSDADTTVDADERLLTLTRRVKA